MAYEGFEVISDLPDLPPLLQHRKAEPSGRQQAVGHQGISMSPPTGGPEAAHLQGARLSGELLLQQTVDLISGKLYLYQPVSRRPDGVQVTVGHGPGLYAVPDAAGVDHGEIRTGGGAVGVGNEVPQGALRSG